MKKFLVAFLICFSMVTTSMDADAAKRFGGGSSFGRPAPTFSQKAPAPSAAPKAPQQQNAAGQQRQQPNAAPAQQAQRPSMMRSVLTGLAAALGISALLSLLGIEGAGLVSLITGILAAVAIFFVLRMVLGMMMRKRVQTSSGYAEPSQYSDVPKDEPQQAARTYEAPAAASGARTGSVMDQFAGGAAQDDGVRDITPDDFDRKAFLETALEQYRKLQKAWDTGNVIEISDFTTTEVFTAITHQLRERGAQAYKSDIKELKNELLGITESDGVYLANIRFTGRIEIDGEVEEFDETWILEKPVEGDEGWLLGGIQQNA